MENFTLYFSLNKKSKFFIVILLSIAILISISMVRYEYRYSMSEPVYTGNPDECWFEDDTGKMTACKIESVNSAHKLLASGFFRVGPWAIVGLLIFFIYYTKVRSH